MTSARDLVSQLHERGLTIAVAESLTGGWVCGELVSVPGSSSVLRGGVVAYSVDAKRTLLHLTDEDLAAGVVSETVAAGMAQAVATILGADVGLATTGAAGPEPHEGAPAGRVCLGVWTAGGTRAWTVTLGGDRDSIRRASVHEALRGTLELLARL